MWSFSYDAPNTHYSFSAATCKRRLPDLSGRHNQTTSNELLKEHDGLELRFGYLPTSDKLRLLLLQPAQREQPDGRRGPRG